MHEMKSESEVTQPFPTLSDPKNCSLPDSATHGIFQARVLEWAAIAFSGKIIYIYIYIIESLPCIPETNIRLEINYAAAAAELLQLCPSLWDPMDCSQPGSSVHGIP